MKVTEVEYETTEKEVQRYKCDNCSQVVDESKINTALITTGDYISGISGSGADESKHLCEECIGLQNALRVQEKEEYLKARWEGFSNGLSFAVSYLTVCLAFLTGVFSVTIAAIMPPDEAGVLSTSFAVDVFWGGILAGAVVVAVSLLVYGYVDS